MGKKRTGTKLSGPVSWVWKSVLLGGLIGAGLCALAAALVMGSVIPQEGLMTAGRCAALLGAVASGLICACMAKERKVQWAAVASGCTAVCALMVNAVVRLCKSNVRDWFGLALAVAAFVLTVVIDISPVFPVLGAAILGIFAGMFTERGGKQ